MKMELLQDLFAIAQLSPEASPALEPMCFLARTDKELSWTGPQQLLPASALHVQKNYRAFRVAGQMDLSLVGVMRDLSAALAAAGIPLFALSTYDTDYILVPQLRLQDAISAFNQRGISVRRLCRIEPLTADQLPDALSMVRRVFLIFEGTHIPREGIEMFFGFTDHAFMKARFDSGEFRFFGAWDGDTLLGAMVLNRSGHIELLYIQPQYHRQGVGAQLIRHAMSLHSHLDLRASSFGFPLYRSMGFEVTGPLHNNHGLITTPMAWNSTKSQEEHNQ